MRKLLANISLFFSIAACHTVEKFPEAKDVNTGANIPNKDCREIGSIRGRANSKTPDMEAAMKDLKMEAANKGANYVQIKEKSGYGTEVVGVAFNCP
ncbi:MAG: hypothetical protein A4S09_07785 [Proteobacteria bacterium SG_bin7]|nr:MAG: hypothetical protein A4S09_07785 [Proteobacteria bacterium SG_bin7]